MILHGYAFPSFPCLNIGFDFAAFFFLRSCELFMIPFGKWKLAIFGGELLYLYWSRYFACSRDKFLRLLARNKINNVASTSGSHKS